MNTAIVTTVSTGYIHYLKTMLKSIKKHNGTKYPVIVLCHDNKKHQKCVYNFDIAEIRVIYPADVRLVDPEPYERFNVNNVKFFSLEAFGMTEFDRVIFLDSDILNVAPLDGLDNIEGDLCMTREESRQDTLNKGVMVIGKKHLDKSLPGILRNHEGRKGYGTDQSLIASYFDGRITELPRRYNALVTESEPENVVNFHYVVKHDTSNFRDRCGKRLYNIYRNYEELE